MEINGAYTKPLLTACSACLYVRLPSLELICLMVFLSGFT